MVAGTARTALPDRRISARMVPKMMPPMVAMMVSCTLKKKPLMTNLEMISQLTKLRSSPNMSVPPARGTSHDKTRDAHALLDKGHHAVHDERGQRIGSRHRQIDLDATRGFFLGLHGEHGELGNRHRESHG